MGSPDPNPDDSRFLRRLLAAREPIQALQAGVDQVVEVLECPASWSGVIEGDQLVMGAHQGIVSAGMAAAWHLKVGEGIGGRVVTDRQPHTSRDYRHDYRRVPLLKRLIDDEGIISTLVVPILAADHVLGVLYAARREAYAWSEAQTATLVGIAHDVAIRLTQLDIDGRCASEASSARDDVRRAVRRGQACARLMVNAAQDADPRAALDLLAVELGCRVDVEAWDVQSYVAGREPSVSDPVTVGSAEAEGCDAITVTTARGHDLDELDRSFVDLCVGVYRLQTLRVTERLRTAERLSGELLDDLFSGRIGRVEEFQARVSLMGLSLHHGCGVVVAGAAGEIPPSTAVLTETLERAGLHVAGTAVKDGRPVAITDVRSIESAEVRTTLEDLMARNLPASVLGVGGPCACLDEYETSYREALGACEMVLRGDAEGTIARAVRMGIVGLASLSEVQLRAMVRDAIGPLLDLDRCRNTDLVHTLRVFLTNDRHLPDTASALFVHYNTVRNRIARAEEVLGVDLGDVDDRFRVETALRLHALSQALGR